MLKVPGVPGSFQLRKIKGKAYWYHYWYDPTSKKMKSKRRDPPKEYIPARDSPHNDFGITNELPMRTKGVYKTKYETLYNNIIQLVSRCLVNQVKHQRPRGWIVDELLELDPQLEADIAELDGYDRLAYLLEKRDENRKRRQRQGTYYSKYKQSSLLDW